MFGSGTDVSVRQLDRAFHMASTTSWRTPLIDSTALRVPQRSAGGAAMGGWVLGVVCVSVREGLRVLGGSATSRVLGWEWAAAGALDHCVDVSRRWQSSLPLG